MQISSAIAQLRTTDLAESIRFYTTKVGLTLEFQYQDFYAGIGQAVSSFTSSSQTRRTPLSSSWIRASTSTCTLKRTMPRRRRPR